MADIMIIDDKPYMNSIISEDLARDGHYISCFGDTHSAMDELHLHRPDIVLFDLYFNGIEDWDMLHDIKMEYPDMPVIIVSAYRNFLTDIRLEEADGFVIKNFRTDNIKKKIEEVLERKNI